MSTDQPKYVTTEQAAAHLGVSPSFMEKARKAGTGPTVTRLGRVVRYTVADLDLWAAEQRVTPEPAKLLAPAPRQPRQQVRVVTEQRHVVHVRRVADLPAWERPGVMAMMDDRVRCFALLAQVGGVGGLSAQDCETHAAECAERAYRDAADAIREERGLGTRAYSKPVSRQALRDLVANRYPIIDVNAPRWFRTDERFKSRMVRWTEQGLFVRVHVEDLLRHFPELDPDDVAHLRVDAMSDVSMTSES